MQKIVLLPADTYTVINRTIISDSDKKNLLNLYEPIVGALPISLYLTLVSDLDKSETVSKDYQHHHLMTFLKTRLDDIEDARKSLEAMGLLKVYLKRDANINHYIYELYSPISAYDFFNHPILNTVLYNNLGQTEYNNLIKAYKKQSFNLEEYQDITSKFNDVYKSEVSSISMTEDIKNKSSNKPQVDELIDFNLLISSIPSNIINDRAFNKKTRDLINNLSFIYNVDTIK